MSVTKEKYSEKRITTIYQLMLNEKEAGHPKDYDIIVDDLKVVSRTNDTENFYNHEDFIQEDTKSVTISLYIGNSRRYTRYILQLKEEEPTQQKTLAGIEKSVDEKLAQARSNWEYDQLKKDYEELEEKLEESEEYAEQLKNEVDHLKSENEKNKSSNKITDTVISLAGIYLSKNPNALNGVPLLGGLLGGGNSSQTNEKEEVTTEECTVKVEEQKESSTKKFTGEIKQKDVEDLQMALIPFFNEPDLDSMENIIIYLNKYNSYIPHVLQGLLKAVNTKEKEQMKQAA